MNPSAIYSKSGKGVQEAAGKTSHLSRPDRAVLSAIDGRATLADVAQKVGKSFDAAFEKLIESLDKGGFIREVSPGTAAPGPKPGAGKAAAKATSPMDAASDLDFTSVMGAPAKPVPPPQAPPRAAPPPPKHTVTIPPAPPPPSAEEKAKAERIAREQQDAFVKAREEAERKAAAERERVKAEAEERLRAETSAKLRAEAEKKAAAEAEAKIKAAREAAVKAAAEAKAKAEAEAKAAREEAERIRKEAEERARREQEELKRKLEEERKAREEAERKAKEEARRLEEERRKLEEERKRHEEEKRREEEERTQRRIQEERERVERKRRQQEEEEREERRKAKAREEAAEQPPEEPRPKAKEPEPAKAAGGGGFSDSLLADLESFTTRDEHEQKEREEAERKAKEEAARRAREAEERRAKEEGERQEREAKEKRKREEAERKAEEEAELREREEREKARLKEEEEKRKREAEEREKKAKQEERTAAKATRGAGFEEAEARSRRERQLGKAPAAGKAAAGAAARAGWRKPIVIALFLLVAVALGVAHIMPIDVSDYQSAATDALRRPVKIGSANLSLVTGLQVKFKNVIIGETRIAEVRAYPDFDALLGPKKSFGRIEIDGAKLEQQALGELLFAKVKGDNFSVAKLVARNFELTGPAATPKGLEAELNFDREGALRSAVLRGPEGLVAKLSAKGSSALEVDMTASSFTLPFAPEISFAKFSMKGTATPQGMSVSGWDGAIFSGMLSGTANVRWGDSWIVDGVVTARSINAAVFAPALLSDGKGEGSGKFSMRGQPGKLAATSRLDGSFTVTGGVLGSIDLSRAIQTGGKQATGRTQFKEMNGQGVYDRGTVSLRNVTIGAGQLNAGASAEIAPNGALSGRIVADVRVASQTLRATLNLGGTVKEPQVRN